MRALISPDLLNELTSHVDADTTLVTPESPDYDRSIARWSDGAVKRAGVVAFPTTAEAVSTLLKFASKHGLDIAVKGGGHSTGGTSSSEGGLVIDLAKMRTITINKEKKLIIAQGGALWEDVDDAAFQEGLATVGGTISHTGIGGLTLGGGFGWLSGMYGPVIDNLVGAKLVIADGTILNLSSTDNQDLFWAIRGAGTSFGVVTEFAFQAYDQPNPVYMGQLVFPLEKLVPLIEAFNTRMAHPDPRGAGSLFCALPPGAPGPVLIIVLFYNGSEAEGKKYHSAIFDLGPVDTNISEIPYNQVNRSLNALAPFGGRKATKAISLAHPVKVEQVQTLVDDFTKQTQQHPEMAGSAIGIEFYDLRKSASVPLDATAFSTRGSFGTGIFILQWANAESDEVVRGFGRKLQGLCRQWIEEDGQQANSGATFEYANYTEPEDVRGNPRPFGKNQERLIELKKKYDPEGLFDKSALVTTR